MAEQSFLAKLGVRLGVLGSAASLAIAAPLAAGNYDPSCHTDAARTGWYFDRTAGAEKIGMVVGGLSAVLFTRSGSNVNVTMLTPDASISLGDGTGGPHFYMNGAAGQNRFVSFQTAGALRWEFGINNDAEGGANSGSNVVLNSYADDGVTLIDTPLTIVRAALGVWTFARPLTVSAGTFSGSSTSVINASCTWNNAATTFTAFALTVTDTASAAGSLLVNFRQGATQRYTIAKTGAIVNSSIDDLTSAQWQVTRSSTITGNITDSEQMTVTAALDGAFTVTRYNYITIANLTGAATVTNGCVIRFNANAGTHKALDAGTTKVTFTGVDAWMKININGTIYFKPMYLSKTA
jgi:hypothetical protein